MYDFIQNPHYTKSPTSFRDEAGDFYVCTVSGCGVMNFRRISVELKFQANHLFRINEVLFCGQVKRFLHIFSGLVAGHRQVVQQIGARQAARRSPINDAVFPKITYQDVIEPEEVLTDCRPSSPTGSQRWDSSTNGHKKCALKRKKNFLGRNIR